MIFFFFYNTQLFVRLFMVLCFVLVLYCMSIAVSDEILFAYIYIYIMHET